MSKSVHLSKSRLLAFRQCPKRLWLSIHEPDLAKNSQATEMRFATGHQVGEIARGQFANGVLIGHPDNLAEALRETRKVLRRLPERPVFEAAFEHDGVLVRADVMLPARGKYRVIEVKSSASVKDYHYTDCATQTWVMRESGVPVSTVAVAHIDSSFVYPGNGDYRGLFARQTVDEHIAPLLPEVPKWVANARSTLEGEMPEIEMGEQCTEPFPCAFQGFCSQGLPPGPDYPVTALPRAPGKRAAAELLSEGIDDIREIPEGRLDNETLERIRRATVTGIPYLDPGARDEIAEHGFPRTYIDFETARFAVPIWVGTRPYQKLPFQWSCHIERDDGALEHGEFLDETGEAPMRRFAQTLLEVIPGEGPVFVYHSSFEVGRLQELAAMYPELRERIERVIERIVDLLPIAKRRYYHRDMLGSWSLKAVLPTIAPDLDYDNLEEVTEGAEAEMAYLEMIEPGTSAERKDDLARKLRAYCARDTLALVRLVGFFEGRDR